MITSLIVATSKNNAIGVNNTLPWHLPADLKYFKHLTSGHCIIMGSNTFQSIGKALPNRTNIVVTNQTNPNWLCDGIVIKNSIKDAITFAQEQNETECFIIGGASIYKQTLDLCNKIYLTEIDVLIKHADAFFPTLDEKWNLIFEELHQPDEKNKMNYCFKTYQKK